MTREYLERQQLRHQAKAAALAEARREERERKSSRISDVGKAEAQPVSYEVLEAAQDEIARLQAEVKRLKATIDAPQRQIRALSPIPVDKNCVPDGWRELGEDEVILGGDMWSESGEWRRKEQARAVIGNTLGFYRERFARPAPDCKAWRQEPPSPVPVHPPSNVTHRGAQ